MKAGDEYRCPRCGTNGFLVKKPVVDGWTKKGDILACSSCGGKVSEIKNNPLSEGNGETNTAAISKLASFLGANKTVHKKLTVSEAEKHFCKDCEHFIRHPFHDRCGRFDQNVNPMDDCLSFSARKPPETTTTGDARVDSGKS